MSDRLSDAFEVCLAALKTGVGGEACVELYPDLAAELRPALETALLAISSAPVGVPAAAIHDSRERVLAMGNALRRRQRFQPFHAIPRFALAGLAAVLGAFVGLGGLVVASAQALPGDALYPIKRASESVSLSLSSAGARQTLQVDYSQRRTHEVLSLLDLSRTAPVSFQGVVRQQSSDRLVVDGITVQLPEDVKVTGKIADGVTVEVEGETESGGVRATQVRLKAYELDGTIQAIAAPRWKVDGVEFLTNENTIVSPGVGVGDAVIVLLEVDEHGLTQARAILRAQASEAPPEVEATPTPETPSGPTAGAPTEGPSDQTTEFDGTLQAVAGSTWTAGGRTLRVGSQTEIDGSPKVGDSLRVTASQGPDGVWNAQKIEVTTGGDTGGGGGEGGATPGPTPTGGSGGDGGGESHNDPVTVTGTVSRISGASWTIAGQVFSVDGSTEIHDNPQVGDTVRVTATRQPDGSLLASQIEIADH